MNAFNEQLQNINVSSRHTTGSFSSNTQSHKSRNNIDNYHCDFMEDNNNQDFIQNYDPLNMAKRSSCPNFMNGSQPQQFSVHRNDSFNHVDLGYQNSNEFQINNLNSNPDDFITPKTSCLNSALREMRELTYDQQHFENIQPNIMNRLDQFGNAPMTKRDHENTKQHLNF